MVLDLMLPGIDGLEVMRRMREHQRRRSAIILLTAKGEPTDRVTGLRLGADDYVAKPKRSAFRASHPYDPVRGHLRFAPAEVEAVQRVSRAEDRRLKSLQP